MFNRDNRRGWSDSFLDYFHRKHKYNDSLRGRTRLTNARLCSADHLALFNLEQVSMCEDALLFDCPLLEVKRIVSDVQQKRNYVWRSSNESINSMINVIMLSINLGLYRSCHSLSLNTREKTDLSLVRSFVLSRWSSSFDKCFIIALIAPASTRGRERKRERVSLGRDRTWRLSIICWAQQDVDGWLENTARGCPSWMESRHGPYVHVCFPLENEREEQSLSHKKYSEVVWDTQHICSLCPTKARKAKIRYLIDDLWSVFHWERER